MSVHERELDDDGDHRLAKRIKVDVGSESMSVFQEPAQDVEMDLELQRARVEHSSDGLLPPSKSLLPHNRSEKPDDDGVFRINEPDVGISEYISNDVPRIEGIIKQRFTDFLVFEVDLQGHVVHLKSIDKPEPSKASGDDDASEQCSSAASSGDTISQSEGNKTSPSKESEIKDIMSEEHQISTEAETEPWPESFTEALAPLISRTASEELKEMFLQGPAPPFVSEEVPSLEDIATSNSQAPSEGTSKNKRRNDRGGRARRGRGKGGREGREGVARKEDHRRVISDPIPSKQQRTSIHEVIRDLFKGKLETETDNKGEGRIVIRWSKTKGSGAKRGSKEDAISQGGRGNPFPYIHFTMQKTNRDTQDAISHISRLLHVNVKDLSVAGTKDKRGVTTQRVSLRRNGKTVEDVWKALNGLTGRRTYHQAVTERGERGVRIGDLSCRKGFLELGMLRGNAFVITLRNVRVESIETMDRALVSLKNNGFINYYGMQRFGTASIPTHAIGLALLRSDWTKAVSLIMRPRPGEYVDAEAARRAWLEERDLDKALSLMPRRIVAERCILESYKKQKGDDRNALGAISAIPRNLRLMYIHAYQSYVWNAIVSDRIKVYGQKPIVGDLVFEAHASADDIDDHVKGESRHVNDEELINDDEKGPANKGKKEKKTWQPPRVKALTAEDLDKFSIFDVIMPLPGTDVAYPDGLLGEKYREFLRLDGLDPDNFNRKQRDYTLGGSYRKILHLPKDLSWTIIRYTDPDVALAQSDEDELLGFDPIQTDQDGQFIALQIRMQLGTAAYATMALREVTKTETSAHHQSILTQASDDQKFRGLGE